MSALPRSGLSPFAVDVLEGLSSPHKSIPSRYFYDDIGLALFQAVAKLPGFGIARAEDRLLRRHASELAEMIPRTGLVAELVGSSNDWTNQLIRKSLGTGVHLYSGPACATMIGKDAGVWLSEVSRAISNRHGNQSALVVLLGNAMGNLDRGSLQSFLETLRALLKPGDYFLFSADLVKDIDTMLCAYDDGFGVMAAFNRNLLARINRELGGRFEGGNFQHHVKWDAFSRRVDLELITTKQMDVYISALGRRFPFKEREAIHTGSYYKFTELELETLAGISGFQFRKSWVDIEWSFAQVLWTV